MDFLDIFRRRKHEEPVETGPKRIEFDNIKQRDEDGFYPIVCPYCLEEFHIWEAEFRAYGENARVADVNAAVAGGGTGESSSFDDLFNTDVRSIDEAPVMEEKEHAFPLETDEKFENFERKVAGAQGTAQGHVLKLFKEDGSPTGEVKSVWLMNPKTGARMGNHPISLHGTWKDDFDRKPIFSVRDKYDRFQAERLCPHCHHAVSDLVGIWPSYTIALIGNTKCGKSVYLTALGGALSSGILTENTLTGITVGKDADWSSRYLEMRKRAAKGDQLLEGTSIAFMPPQVLECTRAEEQEGFILNLFDFPGEVLKKPNDNFDAHYLNKIGYIDGWMFLFDAISFNTIRNAVGENEELRDAIVEGTKDSPNILLSRVRQRYAPNATRFDTPVAFVITKIDLAKFAKEDDPTVLESLYDSTPIFEDNRNQARDYADLDDISTCENVIKDLLSEDAEDKEIYRNAKECVIGREAAWFALSAKGTPGEGVQAPPVRVSEPLEWLLWRFGVIAGYGENGDVPGGDKRKE